MHEMSLALNIIDIVSTQAQLEEAIRINEVEIEVGRLGGVIPDSLEFCFDIASRNTIVEGAQLKIIEIQGEGTCRSCQGIFPMETVLTPCPSCDSFTIQVTRGQELKVRSIIID